MGEVLGRFPCAIFYSVAFPVDKVLNTAMSDATTQNGLDFIFFVIADDDRRRRFADAARDCVLVRRFKEGDVEDGVYLYGRRQLEFVCASADLANNLE